MTAGLLPQGLGLYPAREAVPRPANKDRLEYWDRPRNAWPRQPDSSLDMYTRPLDLTDLLNELQA